MRLERIELREIDMPLKEPFETSFGRFCKRRVLLVHIWDRDGVQGWGECTALSLPTYSHETVDTAWLIIRQVIAPLVLARDISHPSEVNDRLSGIRGHPMAKAAVETACWELEARRAALPLWRYLGGRRAEIPSGASIGIQTSAQVLLEKIDRDRSAGYHRIKLKIKPGLDVETVRHVRRHHPDLPLMVDANAAYRLEDLATFVELDQVDLMMIEQPLPHDDLIDHAALQRHLRTPVCLDESIVSVDHARQAIAIGSCRVVNIKLGRVGGYAEAMRILQTCSRNSIGAWCGGMLESGIGRAHNIALSSLDGFTLPGDVSASSRYWEQDIVTPAIEVSPQGTIHLPGAPGLGYQIDEDRLSVLTTRTESVR